MEELEIASDPLPWRSRIDSSERGWSPVWFSCPVACCIPTGDLGLGTSKVRNESSCLLRFGGRGSEPFLSVWSGTVLSLITAMQPELLAALLESGFWRGNIWEVTFRRTGTLWIVFTAVDTQSSTWHVVEIHMHLWNPYSWLVPCFPCWPLLSVSPLARPSHRLFFLHKMLFHLCNILLPA